MPRWSLLLTSLLVLFPALAPAATLVLPSATATTEGNTNLYNPFDLALFRIDNTRFQQAYAGPAFGALPVAITEIAFRQDRFATPFSTVLPDIQMSFSTTARAVDGLARRWEDNLGPDKVVFQTGDLALSSAPSTASPRPFDITIPLPTPFVFNPAQGNLLLEVINYGGGSSTPFDATDVLGDEVSRLWINTDGGAFAPEGNNDFSASIGLVTHFTYTVIPEPSAAALLTVFLAIGQRRR